MAKNNEYYVNIRILFTEQVTAKSAEEAKSKLLQKIDKAICNRYEVDDLEWEFLTIDADKIK